MAETNAPMRPQFCDTVWHEGMPEAIDPNKFTNYIREKIIKNPEYQKQIKQLDGITDEIAQNTIPFLNKNTKSGRVTLAFPLKNRVHTLKLTGNEELKKAVKEFFSSPEEIDKSLQAKEDPKETFRQKADKLRNGSTSPSKNAANDDISSFFFNGSDDDDLSGLFPPPPGSRSRSDPPEDKPEDDDLSDSPPPGSRSRSDLPEGKPDDELSDLFPPSPAPVPGPGDDGGGLAPAPVPVPDPGDDGSGLVPAPRSGPRATPKESQKEELERKSKEYFEQKLLEVNRNVQQTRESLARLEETLKKNGFLDKPLDSIDAQLDGIEKDIDILNKNIKSNVNNTNEIHKNLITTNAKLKSLEDQIIEKERSFLGEFQKFQDEFLQLTLDDKEELKEQFSAELNNLKEKISEASRLFAQAIQESTQKQIDQAKVEIREEMQRQIGLNMDAFAEERVGEKREILRELSGLQEQIRALELLANPLRPSSATTKIARIAGMAAVMYAVAMPIISSISFTSPAYLT